MGTADSNGTGGTPRARTGGRRGLRFRAALVAGVVMAGAGTFRALRTPWVVSLPEVDVVRTRPVLTGADVGPESAYGLLMRAGDLPKVRTIPAEARCRFPGTDVDIALWLADRKIRALGLPSRPPDPQAIPALLAPYMPPGSEAGAGGLGEVLMVDPAEDAEPPELVLFAADRPWNDLEMMVLARAAEAIRPNVALARRAAAFSRPPVPWRNGRLPYSGLDAARVLLFSAEMAAAAGDVASALADIEAAIRCGVIPTRGGDSLSHLLEHDVTTRALELLWEVTVGRAAPPVAGRSLLRGLAEIEGDLEPMSEFVRSESREIPALVGNYYADGTAHRVSTLKLGDMAPWRAFLQVRLRPLLSGSSEAATRRNLEALATHLVELADRPHAAGGWEALRDRVFAPRHSAWGAVTCGDVVGLALAERITLPLLENFCLRAEKRLLHLRLARVYLAAKL